MKPLGAAGQRHVALAILDGPRGRENLDQAAGAGRRVAQPRAEQVGGDWRSASKPCWATIAPTKEWSLRGTNGPIPAARRLQRLSPMWALIAQPNRSGRTEPGSIRASSSASSATRSHKASTFSWSGAESANVDRSADQLVVGNSGQAGQAAHRAAPFAHGIPDAFAIVADRGDQADAGDDDWLRMRELRGHKQEPQVSDMTRCDPVPGLPRTGKPRSQLNRPPGRRKIEDCTRIRAAIANCKAAAAGKRVVDAASTPNLLQRSECASSA